MNKNLSKIVVFAFLGLFLFASATLLQSKSNDSGKIVAAVEPASGEISNGTTVGGGFSLIDDNGQAVTEQDYGDSYKLIFFGFTNCPDVCPEGLQKMANVLNAIGPQADKIQPLFITIDPARDTPEVMKDYVEMFHPRLIGLTGTKEQVKAVEKAYKVYSAKVEMPEMDNYTMNHSAYMYLMSPDNKLTALYSANEKASDIVKDMMKRL